MKVVVIIIMVAISLLFIYMSFLLCLDPLMNQSGKTKKPTSTSNATRQTKHHHERQLNAELQVDNPTQECVFSEPTPVSALPANQRSSTVLNMVSHGQSKWRKQVCRFSLIESTLHLCLSVLRYNNNGNQYITNMNYLISHSKVNQIKIYVHKLPILTSV